MERNDAIKVGMISLGCNKNQVDAELMLGTLAREGFIISDDQDNCDVIIVNTCGFIESAKKESIENILECCRLKDEGKIKLVVVTGCLAERYRDEVAELIPEADVILGIGANDEIVSAIKTALSGKKIACFYAPENLVTEGDRILVNDPHYAYIRIADGCDNRCAYCAIPMIRGRYRSRSMDKILAECTELAEKGVKELIIIAQDTTRYGVDIYGKRMLPELLRAICRIDGVKWVRLLYAYPERVTEELLDVFAEEEKMVKYIDIPLQHCSRKVLRAMRRHPYTPAELMEFINHIRERVPGICLRTTLLSPASPAKATATLKLSANLFVRQNLTALAALHSPARKTPPPTICRTSLMKKQSSAAPRLLWKFRQVFLRRSSAKKSTPFRKSSWRATTKNTGAMWVVPPRMRRKSTALFILKAPPIITLEISSA